MEKSLKAQIVIALARDIYKDSMMNIHGELPEFGNQCLLLSEVAFTAAEIWVDQQQQYWLNHGGDDESA